MSTTEHLLPVIDSANTDDVCTPQNGVYEPTNDDVVRQQPEEHTLAQSCDKQAQHNSNTNIHPMNETYLLQPLTQCLPTLSSLFQTALNAHSSLKFHHLQKKARLCVKISEEGDRAVPLTANDNYLLFCPAKRLCVIDEKGAEYLNIERNFNVTDLCWSTYLSQFLILSDKLLYALDLTTKQLSIIMQFGQSMSCCTCYADTFMVRPTKAGLSSAVYNMSHTANKWTLVRPSSQVRVGLTAVNTLVNAIRFNSNGSCGVIRWHGLSPSTWLEFFGRYDLSVIQDSFRLETFSSSYKRWHLITLPDQFFLANQIPDRKLLLIDINKHVRELNVLFDSENDSVFTTAFIGGEKKCLVVQIANELRFYDL